MEDKARHGGSKRQAEPRAESPARRWAGVAVVLVVTLAGADAARADAAKGAAGHAAKRSPVMRPGLQPDSVLKLTQAFALATRRVEKTEGCRALFTKLGSSGAEKLTATIYQEAPPVVVERRCRGGAAAATNPGSALTWVCPAFSALKVQRAAVTLIHEALHFAGMPERPLVASALTSAQINDLVRDSCGL